MKASEIDKIRDAAMRVVDRCDDWLNRYSDDDTFKRYCDISGYRETGAVKRAVLDFKHDTRKVDK